MNRHEIQKIKKEKEETICQMKEILIGGHQNSLNRKLDKIKALDAVVRYHDENNRKGLIWPAVFCCLIIAAVTLSIIPYPWTKIILKVKCDAVSICLSDRWKPWNGDLENITFAGIRLSRVNHVEIPWSDINLTDPNRMIFADLKGETIHFDLSFIEKEGWIDFERITSEIKVSIKNSALEGQLYGTGRLKLSTGEISKPTLSSEWILSGETPKSILFSSSKSDRQPAVVYLSPPRWKSSHFPVSAMNFTRRITDPNRNARLVSYILDGELILPEFSKTIKIKKGEILRFKGINGDISKLETNDNINLVFEGQSRRISAGPNLFIKNFTPSFLEYLYHQQKHGIFLSALLGIWSILCILRQLFSRQSH